MSTRMLALLALLGLLAASASPSYAQVCDDGNACTVGDALVGGICTGGAVRNCDDSNPCTDDVCDSSLGCVHAASSDSCSDGNVCTTTDVCRAGACVGGDTGPGCAPCEAVAVVPATGGTFLGTTAGTGTLGGNCGSSTLAPERVYAWTPATAGTAIISTCGSQTRFDSVVYVRQDACSGAELGCNDDTVGCPTGEPSDYHGSRVMLTVAAGATYFLIVDGYDGARGAYALTIEPPSTCGNEVREGGEECDGVDRAACVSGACSATCRCVEPAGGLPDLVPEISDVSVEFGAIVAAGDVAEGCAEATSGVDLLRFGVTSRNAGTADLRFGDPACPAPCIDYPLAVCGNPEFVCSPAQGHNHPHYTNYARYELLDAAGQLMVVGHKQGYCLRDTSCSAPVYTCTNQGITAGCADLYGANLGCQYLDITDVPAGPYTLRVTMDPFGRIAELSDANNVAEVPVILTRPGATPTVTPIGPTIGPTSTPALVATVTPTVTATRTPTPVPSPGLTGTPTATPTSVATPVDACGAALVIPAGGGTLTGTTAGTSAWQGSCGASGTSPERVYQWTPVISGTATIHTCNASATRFDTVLYLLNGCSAGQEITCNDDTIDCFTAEPNDHHGSRLAPTVTAGQTYFIVVDGYGGAQGDFTLTVVAPGGTTTATPGISSTGTPTPVRTATPAVPTSTVTPAPSACTLATAIPAAGGTFTGVTSGTGTLAGTCATSRVAPERVFQWTPARSGTVQIQTCGSATGFDTVVYLRQRDCLTGTQVACNDDSSGCGTGEPNDHHGSRLSTAVTAGETYFIVVDGYNQAAGAFSLTVTLP